MVCNNRLVIITNNLFSMGFKMKISSEIILKIHSRTYFLWPIFISLMLVMTAMVTILADVGLADAQKQMPNAFHGKYFNYSNLWLMMEIFPFFSLIFIVITGLAIMAYPRDKQYKPGVEHE